MSIDSHFIQYTVLLLIITVLVKPAGRYMADVFERKPTKLDRVLLPIERLTLRIIGVKPEKTMAWREYAYAFVATTLCGALLLYLLLRMQTLMPWFYPKYMNTPMSPDLAMNTAISFVTTSTWQAYGGETTMSYFSQMLALGSGSFLGGAAGLAVGMAFIRGFAYSKTNFLGNFYVDFFRALYWILLPISLIGGVILVSQGVPMNFNHYTEALGLEGQQQVIAQGPVAALELIKNLGTNGGGFFNVNGAHPYANPTPLTNFLGMLAIAVLPASLTYTFGYMTGRLREGWALYVVMVMLFVAGLGWCDWAESSGNPSITRVAGLSSSANMEGKEVRFGIPQSVLTAVTTSNTSTGSYNSMHDSYTPIGGMVPLINMCIGQFIFGGLGGGLSCIVLWVLLTLFLVGLMVGRTPEYIGQKIGPKEMKLVTLYTVASPLIILIPTAVAVVTDWGLAGLTTNTGAHGLTEIIYAYASSNANNGQNFAGLNANSPFYNITTSLAMMAGRFALGIPVLALAGQFSAQPTRPSSHGTIPTDCPTFICAMVGVILIVGMLNYFPAITLGALLEHRLMCQGQLF